MHTVGPGIWQENSEIMENEKHPLDDLKNEEITEKRKNENAHCRTWNMARKLKITENEKYTL